METFILMIAEDSENFPYLLWQQYINLLLQYTDLIML